MAKKFLDILGDAFEDDALADIIPAERSRRRGAESEKESAPPKRKRTSQRRKRFVERMNESMPADPQAKPQRKSLLDTMEEALDNQVFDDLFPKARPRRNRKPGGAIPPPDPNLESRFSTMITTQVLNRAREIAEAKGIRVKEVINAALQLYIEQESPEN